MKGYAATQHTHKAHTPINWEYSKINPSSYYHDIHIWSIHNISATDCYIYICQLMLFLFWILLYYNNKEKIGCTWIGHSMKPRTLLRKWDWWWCSFVIFWRAYKSWDWWWCTFAIFKSACKSWDIGARVWMRCTIITPRKPSS